MRSMIRVGLFSALVLALGCSSGPAQPKSAAVKGKVTLDGAPLASGSIVFDEGPSVPATAVEIKNGEYSGTATVGKKTVRISAFKAAPAPKDMTGAAYEGGNKVNYLPARYNTASTEVREVKEGGPNEFDFQVKSK